MNTPLEKLRRKLIFKKGFLLVIVLLKCTKSSQLETTTANRFFGMRKWLVASSSIVSTNHTLNLDSNLLKDVCF